MTKPFREIIPRPDYQRDFARLNRRYRTLAEDIDTFIKVALQLFHTLGQPNNHIHRLGGLGFTEPPIYKAKRIACRALKGTGSNSGLRLIYAYFAESKRLELIEIYYKGDKENEDRNRIKYLYLKVSQATTNNETDRRPPPPPNRYRRGSIK